MVDIDLKALVGRLNPNCKRALETAAGICVSRTNYEVLLEHVLQPLLEDTNGDVYHILNHYGIDHSRVNRALVSTIDGFKTGNQGRPVLSPLLQDWLKQAWLLASLQYGQAEIRSGNLFQALIASPRIAAGDYVDLFEDLNKDDLKKNFFDAVGPSSESARRSVAEAGGAPSAGGQGDAPGGEGTALAQFCVCFTQRAREGHIDPVFGRDREIRQMIDVLARRRKNKPIAVGEAGGGKTHRRSQGGRVKPAATRGPAQILTDAQDRPPGKDLHVHVAGARSGMLSIDLYRAAADKTPLCKGLGKPGKDQVGITASRRHGVGKFHLGSSSRKCLGSTVQSRSRRRPSLRP